MKTAKAILAIVLVASLPTGVAVAKAKKAGAKGAASAPIAHDGKRFSGKFTTTDADGNVAHWTLYPNERLEVVHGDGRVQTGVHIKDPVNHQNCIDFDEDGKGPFCFAETKAENGQWQATRADGHGVTVQRHSE